MRSCYHKLANRKKLIFPLKNTSKLWTTWSLALLAQNIYSRLIFFKVGKIMVSKYGYSMLPGVFLDIESCPWYWFHRWSNSSVICSVVKKTFVEAGNLQVITNKFWCENLWRRYVLYLDTVLCIKFKKLKHIILAADYMKKNYSVNRAGLCTKT